MRKEIKLTDNEALIRIGPREQITFDRIKDKLKKAKKYKEEYEHMIQLLACNIVQYNEASATERVKLTVNINSISQQLLLTPKAVGDKGFVIEERDELADIMMLKKVK